MRAMTVVVGTWLSLLLPQPVAGQNRLAQPIVVQLPDPSSYVVHRDVPYREVEGRVLLLDAFIPARSGPGPFPVVVFVHGGPLPASVAPQGKDLGQYQSFGPYLTEAGLAAVVFSNGFSDLGAFQSASADVAAALTYVRANAAELNVAPEHICLVHMSAGGVFLAPFLESRPTWLQCIVLYYAVLRPSTFEALGAGTVSVDQTEGLDPFAHVTSSEWAPALFIAEAGRDAPAINAEMRRFRDDAVNAGWAVEYWNHPTGPHGFDAFDPSFRSRLILERTRNFLREQLIGR